MGVGGEVEWNGVEMRWGEGEWMDVLFPHPLPAGIWLKLKTIVHLRVLFFFNCRMPLQLFIKRLTKFYLSKST